MSFELLCHPLFCQAKSGLVLEEDARTVAKLLMTQIAMLMREREERKHHQLNAEEELAGLIVNLIYILLIILYVTIMKYELVDEHLFLDSQT